ncbi:DUF3099 domain-containing protein [Cryobacterium sp. SO2]|uniref:DUF3099 domain-containing protein n=1 Tax=Cryobacterium sp. SO2 TaxID=1897060 RepID=UPI00223E1B08|nr:DUF3099 domain-containing protein [Cryobacterium sp. SO2]WEO75627.1 DUF3099 domain-containing protein [Cryobacterium sp. SO2]
MGTMKQQQSITTLPPSPEQERRSRMIRYSVTMGIRMVCIVLMLFVQGWWLVVCALGAILLPYFAVIAANVHGEQRAPTVLRPGAITLVQRPDQAGNDQARTDQEHPDDKAAGL